MRQKNKHNTDDVTANNQYCDVIVNNNSIYDVIVVHTVSICNVLENNHDANDVTVNA